MLLSALAVAVEAAAIFGGFLLATWLREAIRLFMCFVFAVRRGLHYLCFQW